MIHRVRTQIYMNYPVVAYRYNEFGEKIILGHYSIEAEAKSSLSNLKNQYEIYLKEERP